MEKLTNRLPNLAPFVVTGVLSLAAAAAVTRANSSLILAGLAMVVLVPALLSRYERGTQFALILLLAVPAWDTLGRRQLTVGRVAALLAAVSIILAAINGYKRARPSKVDLAVAGIVAYGLASWWMGPHYPLRLTVNALTGYAFYFAARRCDRDTIIRLLWLLYAASGIGAATVLYEAFVAHHPLFVDQSAYYWNAGEVNLFRPGGIFGSPPAAATVLTMALLAGLPLLKRVRGPARLLARVVLIVDAVAIVVTFTRAALIAAGVALLLYAWMTRRFGRTVCLVTAVGVILAVVALPRIEQSHTFQSGVLRQGTFSARTSYWQLAWPLVTNSTQHLLIGHGIDSLFPAGPQLPATAPQADIAGDPEIIQHGPHNQYIRTLVEEGFLGLGLLLVWLAGSLYAGLRAGRRFDDPIVAGTTAAVAITALAGDQLRNVPTLAIAALLTGITVQLAQIGIEAQQHD